MNRKIPLELFLPPADRFAHINILVTNDHNGLNNGVFLVRVDTWSAQLFAGVLSFRSFEPKKKLKYNDQSALQLLMQKKQFKAGVMHVPQHWLNAYEPTKFKNDTINTSSGTGQIVQGDLFLHFAGNKRLDREARMRPFLALAEGENNSWQLDLNKTDLVNEIEQFWDDQYTQLLNSTQR